MNAQVRSTDLVATKTTTALAVVTASIAEINTFEQGVAELEELYQGVVFDVKDRKGMEAAKEARQAIRKPRYALQNLEKSAKKPLNDLKDAITKQTELMVSRIAALEDPIHEQIKNEEDRILNESIAREKAERERVEALEARLDTIRLMPYDANGLDSKTVRLVLDEARAILIGEDWQEFKDKAASAKIATVAALEGVLAKAEAAEAGAARIIAERAELERLRAEQAERNAQAAAAQKRESDRIAAEQKAEGDRLAAEKAELDRVERERQAAAKAEQEKLEAERRAFALEQESIALAQRERIRIDAVGFRAHHQKMTPEQRERLRALSDASPEVDVFELVLPADPEIILTNDVVVAPTSIGKQRPTDAEIVQCVCEHFAVDIDTASEWLIDFANRNLEERAA